MSTSQPLSTAYAPAERTPETLLIEQSERFTRMGLAPSFLHAIPDLFMVVNQQRQIVFANQSLMQALGISEEHLVLGLRPGEALDCIHAFDNGQGVCGTTEFCRTCGAVQAMLGALGGSHVSRECRITRRDGSALDLRVWATPIKVEGEDYVAFTVRDIGDEKRREVLERLFFHDLLNVAGVIMGHAHLLADDVPADRLARTGEIIARATVRMVDGIKGFWELHAAERGELTATFMHLNSLDLLHRMRSFYQGHEAAVNRTIEIDPAAESVIFVSDLTLLERVLGNLVKNALEACPPGGTVTLGSTVTGEGVSFSVHNPGDMPRDVQLQMFQRSFSTKGSGRGLGTYGVKLLSERYLHGCVSFTSTPDAGTTFTASYPLNPVGNRA